MKKEILAKLQEIEKEYLKKSEQLLDSNIFSDQKKAKEINLFLKKHEEKISLLKKFYKIKDENKEIKKILDLEENSISIAEFKSMLLENNKQLENIEKKLENSLIEIDEQDIKNAIIEIKGAVGGEEANIFASDLFEMYKKFALKNNFIIEVNDQIRTELGGYSFISFSIKGKGAYGMFKYESGVHRVQRVPVTESSGKIHTSTATVLVFSEIDQMKLEISPSDLRIDTYRSSGAGGQHVNKTDSAVRVTHLPTGIFAASQDGRSQHDNKEKAMRILFSKINNKMLQEENRKFSQKKRTILGTGERSEKIRTYNYPENRITDHRINFKSKKLTYIMAGNLDELVLMLRKIYYEN